MAKQQNLHDVIGIWMLGFLVFGIFCGFLWMVHDIGYSSGKWYGKWEQSCVSDGGKVFDGACYSKDVIISVN